MCISQEHRRFRAHYSSVCARRAKHNSASRGNACEQRARHPVGLLWRARLSYESIYIGPGPGPGADPKFRAQGLLCTSSAFHLDQVGAPAGADNTMEAPLYIAILAGQSNMSGRGGVHTSANGTRQWDGVTPPEANAQAGACPAHRRLLPQFHQVCIFQDGVPCTLQAPCCAGVPPARGRTPQSRCTMTLTWGEPFVPATHIYKDGHDMCHTVLSFAAIEHLCATTCACAWSTYQLQGLQSWWSCQAVDGPHTHLRVLGRKACGVGPGLVFAAHLLRSGGAQRMGLVPCAVGGTAMDRWVPGADLYEQMARPLHPSQMQISLHLVSLHLKHTCLKLPDCICACHQGLYNHKQGSLTPFGHHRPAYVRWLPHSCLCRRELGCQVTGYIQMHASAACVQHPYGGGATSMGGPDRQVSRAQSAVDAAPGPASLRVLLWYQVRATASVHACVGTVATCLSSVSPLPQSSTCAVLLPG